MEADELLFELCAFPFFILFIKELQTLWDLVNYTAIIFVEATGHIFSKIELDCVKLYLENNG